MSLSTVSTSSDNGTDHEDERTHHMSLGTAVRRVTGLLNRLTPENFDTTFQKIVTLLTHESIDLAVVLPVIYSYAVHAHDLAEITCTLMSRLFTLLEPTQQAAFRTMLEELGVLLVKELQVKLDDASVPHRHNNITVIRILYQMGLLTFMYIQSILHYLCAEAVTHPVGLLLLVQLSTSMKGLVNPSCPTYASLFRQLQKVYAGTEAESLANQLAALYLP